ncbi:MAG: hypothetical protein AABY22_37010 [Nanoarchaeota archaeon]
MNPKKCLHCGVKIDYDEWKSLMINPADRAWIIKKYCDNSCTSKAGRLKQKIKREKEYARI